MAVIGIERLVYSVDDVDESARFFHDFGLRKEEAVFGTAELSVADGARVVLLPHGHPDLPTGGDIVGPGAQLVIWGVDEERSLHELAERIDRVVKVTWHGDVAHFVTPFGIPMGLRLWKRRPVVCSPDVTNAPGHIARLNRQRKWRLGAQPRLVTHVVFAVPQYDTVFHFMVDVMGFRMTDRQLGVGNYLRADGTTNHHNILLLNADAHLPGMDGKLRFHHANFGLEDVDEIMICVNNMVRKGWKASDQGLGRHRVDSALFYYFPCPAGGEAEFGADSDYVDDNWVPREWINPLFAYSHFVHNLPDFLHAEPDWNFRYITGIEASGEGSWP